MSLLEPGSRLTRRKPLAHHYLAHSDMTTAEIASTLAYQNPDSFCRGFRTWTASTPDMVRGAMRASPAAGPGH